MTKTVFIDGEAGTTGLGIRDRLAVHPGIALRSLPAEHRKDARAKSDLIAQVDCVVLCLPDDAARETVALADAIAGGTAKILDASTAHRVAPGWTYGFPELAAGQGAAVAAAQRVSNPGCYSTGAIALLRPLVDAGLIAADAPITINAISGYSGGGKAMIAAFESGQAPAFELYALGLHHKHVPEIVAHAGLTRGPIFVPSVGRYRQGMLVSIPLHRDLMQSSPRPLDVEAALADHYAGAEHVRVLQAPHAAQTLEPEALNGTNLMELSVHTSADGAQMVLVARLDNLGKGASGAAVQNLALMLRLDADDRRAA